MASTDGADIVQHSLNEGQSNATQPALSSSKDGDPDVQEAGKPGADVSERSAGQPSPAPSSPASGASTAKSGTQPPTVSVQTNPPPLNMPHPKKFSHVNINKKFLEKTSSSTPSHAHSTSPVTKTPISSQKPVLQTSISHPRLVTAKLTATPQPSTTTGPGWSRPSSAVPSNAPTPLPVGTSKASPSLITTVGGAPLPPPAGKVIQPQPRSVQEGVPLRRDPPNKPVWGTTKPNTPHSTKVDGVRSDFPTAAEVAQGRVAQTTEKTSTSDAATIHKQAVMAELQAEEDTFRGVHLDPNAHHWDEMEEDDDNFLDGVIEFGDGRQYTVQSAESLQQTQTQHVTKPPASDLGEAPASNELADHPVSKEERFVDDFDRSWPRSRPPQQAPGQHRDQRSEGHAVSPSVASHSPPESSRVLFNERLNRLEPYSHQRHAPPTGSFNWRGSRSDHPVSPTELRRDAPPHTQFQGVQLLQKGAHTDGHTFSRAPGGDRPPGPSHDGSRFRDRPQRDHGPWQTNGHPGPERHTGALGPPHIPGDAGFNDRARRPPTLEPSADHRRQLPPHFSAVGSRPLPSIRTDGPTPPQPRELPPPSAVSQVTTSPATTDKGLPVSSVPIVDLEEVSKAAMHAAAERARLRRQQEEEEREKERQRARRKAAELEARIKAMEEEKAREREKAAADKTREEAEVVGIIEEAVTSAASVENKPAPAEASSERQPEARSGLVRSVSARGTARPFGTRRPSLTPSAQPTKLPSQPSPASEADTWRRKAAPSVSVSAQSEAQKHPVVPVLPPPVLAHANLTVKAGEEVEVLDFSDHGKLAGTDDKPHHPGLTARPARAVASDFFSDVSTSPQRARLDPSRGEEESSWRRPSYAIVDKPSVPHTTEEISNASSDPSQPQPTQHNGGVPNGLQTTTGSHPPMHEEHSRRVSSHYQNGVLRPPAGASYREAPMSALDDTLSRIKGALYGMHHQEADAPKPQKWIPPALRSKTELSTPSEVFDVTSAEPPLSPKPAWNNFHVKLPHAHGPLPPPQQTELIWPRGRRPFRLDVHSIRPPIHAPNVRDGTVTEHLFGRPRFVRGQPKYFVSIPRRKITHRARSSEASSAPVVHLPSTPIRTRNPALPNDSSSFNAVTWRKTSSTATAVPSVHDDRKETIQLDTVSRSPPPEVSLAASALSSIPKVADSVASSSSGAFAASKSKPEPKMPAGSDVAFYRNSRVEAAVDSQPPVQFIVSSELEGDPAGQSNGENDTAVGQATKSQEHTIGSSAVGVSSFPSPDQKASATPGPSNGVATPSQPSLSPWTKSPKSLSVKESPSRAPDPEHLKAVWSQTSDKAQIQPVNSLKGIADDLPSVPFSLQDVKSDDGGTPPPSGSGTWSRMSSYEVTRAFQQVPSPSSSSSQRPGPIAPSNSTSTNGPASRHPGFALSPPPVGQPALRTAYPAYSPMMSHSPAPSVMYSHPSPVPRPMVVNGSAPAYAQAVWMPMHGTAPPPSAGMMRSPYGPQMMSYPSPGAVPMYPAPMPMQNPSQQNGVQGRPPSMAMMSPVMQPAMSPMYAGSPVLVPTTAVMAPGQAYPMPSQAGRAPGPMRPYEQNSQNGQHMHPSPMRQPPQNGYNPVPSGYARPHW